jgi:hypothetical protein
MSARIPCQCCMRLLVPKADGTSRNHFSTRHSYGEREDYCQGSGYRLDRWPIGQRLEHYTGQVWEVADRSEYRGYGVPGYTMRCVVQTIEKSRPPGTVESFSAEYLHRDGWTPVVDLMGDLERSLERARSAKPHPVRGEQR